MVVSKQADMIREVHSHLECQLVESGASYDPLHLSVSLHLRLKHYNSTSDYHNRSQHARQPTPYDSHQSDVWCRIVLHDPLQYKDLALVARSRRNVVKAVGLGLCYCTLG